MSTCPGVESQELRGVTCPTGPIPSPSSLHPPHHVCSTGHTRLRPKGRKQQSRVSRGRWITSPSVTTILLNCRLRVQENPVKHLQDPQVRVQSKNSSLDSFPDPTATVFRWQRRGPRSVRVSKTSVSTTVQYFSPVPKRLNVKSKVWWVPTYRTRHTPHTLLRKQFVRESDDVCVGSRVPPGRTNGCSALEWEGPRRPCPEESSTGTVGEGRRPNDRTWSVEQFGTKKVIMFLLSVLEIQRILLRIETLRGLSTDRKLSHTYLTSVPGDFTFTSSPSQQTTRQVSVGRKSKTRGVPSHSTSTRLRVSPRKQDPSAPRATRRPGKECCHKSKDSGLSCDEPDTPTKGFFYTHQPNFETSIYKGTSTADHTFSLQVVLQKFTKDEPNKLYDISSQCTCTVEGVLCGLLDVTLELSKNLLVSSLPSPSRPPSTCKSSQETWCGSMTSVKVVLT